MKASAFSYHKPISLEDALSLLESEEEVKILAGGQSLMPMLNMRFVQPEAVIDVNEIEELATISFNGNVEIGALTRQKTLGTHSIIKQHLPIMQEALKWVGHFQFVGNSDELELSRNP